MAVIAKLKKWFYDVLGVEPRKKPRQRKKTAGRKRTGVKKKKPAAQEKATRTKPAKKTPVKKKTVKKKPAEKKPTKKKMTPAKKKPAPVRKKAAVKKAVKKAVQRVSAAPRKTAAVKSPPEVCYGTITHYFPKVRAAVIRIEKTLTNGARIRIQGRETAFTQQVTSLQINRIPVDEGRPGEDVGLEVKKTVAVGDRVLAV